MESVAESLLPLPQRPPSESEWPAFVDIYGRLILDWSRRSGLSPHEAADFTGQLLRHMAEEFVRVVPGTELRFRPWLKYAAHSAWCKLMESQVDHAESSPSSIVRLLLSVEAHDELLRLLDDECVQQRRRAILPHVRIAVDPADWEAFYLSILEGLAPFEVASRMQTSDLAVHAAIHRVGRVLHDELHRWNEQL